MQNILILLIILMYPLQAYKIGVPYLSEPLDPEKSFVILQEHKMLAQSRPGIIRFYDLQTGQELSSIETGSPYDIKSVLVSEDEKYIFAYSWNFKVYQWQLETGKLERTYIGANNDRIQSFDVSSDGSKVVIEIFDSLLFRCIRSLPCKNKRTDM